MLEKLPLTISPVWAACGHCPHLTATGCNVCSHLRLFSCLWRADVITELYNDGCVQGVCIDHMIAM
eukprot:scaffold80356_cov29-Prasinocladus_malaysianus.AAC.1